MTLKAAEPTTVILYQTLTPHQQRVAAFRKALSEAEAEVFRSAVAEFGEDVSFAPAGHPVVKKARADLATKVDKGIKAAQARLLQELYLGMGVQAAIELAQELTGKHWRPE